ncbi:S2611 protein, partial [Acromyrmex heyeri]
MTDEECPPISISKKKSRFTVTKYLPIFEWLPRYTRFKAVSDIIAGITLGLTMIPQSMAYAVLAERIPQYGLYSCFVGGFVYIILGTTKEVSIGPSSLMSLITLQYTRDMPQDFVILLCFLTGCVQFLMSVLNLGFLVDFISVPVTSGFMSAGALIIVIAQLQGFLGLKYKSKSITDNLYQLFKNINKVRLTDFTLAISSFIFLLILKKLKDIDYPCMRNKKDARRNEIIKKVLWYFSILRNALIVLITSTIAYEFEANTGSIPFRLSVYNRGPNITGENIKLCHLNMKFGFVNMKMTVYNQSVSITYLSTDASINATQEMLALGVCNMLSSFVSSLPISGAFTRSGVGSASGVQTPMAGLYSGTMALLALSFLTPYFYYIPRATLSAVLISAVLPMIDLKIIKVLWKGSKTDAIAATGTFVLSILIGIEIGFLLGIFFNLIIFIRFFARSTFQIDNCKTHLGNKYIMLKFDTCLHYPAVTSFCDKVMNLATKDVPLIINCKTFTSLDYTSIKGIETLSKKLNYEKNQFWLLNLNSDIVQNFDIFADNKYIRLIKKKENIADVLYNDALSNQNSEDLINVPLNSQREDSEFISEELVLMSPLECKIRQ